MLVKTMQIAKYREVSMCNMELAVLIRALSRSKENIPSIRLFTNLMFLFHFWFHGSSCDVHVISVCKSVVIRDCSCGALNVFFF
jgi:hypothetical protein